MYVETLNQLSPPHLDAVIEAAFDCTVEIFTGIQRVFELNIQTVRTSLSEQQAFAAAALASGSLSEIIDLQSQRYPAAIKKTSAYWRHVEDIAVQTRDGLFGVMHEHFGSLFQTFAEMFDMASTGFAASHRVGMSSPLAMAQPMLATEGQVSIVDSSGMSFRSTVCRTAGHVHPPPRRRQWEDELFSACWRLDAA
ncbi:phasin family protein [Paraburkholderia sediminicola]|uniref:Phasin family protein n=1 Tax=Paraburkholderia rhynchosiae TaxID=487049 RepID=A0ACC7NPE5_9BURK